ncbi:S-adenosyl-L-methionine-dependent methyltransferase [Xylaria longipes]|nr:S-adenosyl-L-methionine-dependent methyltransferase [Xylaria longipes]
MSGPQSLPRFAQLAQVISSSAAQLQETLMAHKAQFPSFDKDGASQLPEEASNVQDVLVDTAAELHDLLLDPISLLHNYPWRPNGQANYENIARQACLTEPSSLANNTSDSIYDVLASDRRRVQRFANFIKISAPSYDYDAVHVIDSYDWGSLGMATAADVGGSQGHVEIQLAKHFGNLRIVVQDVESVITGRVRFEAHDFFQPQVVAADVFSLRLVLHNWTDKYAARILVIIMDVYVKERGIFRLWKEKFVRHGSVRDLFRAQTTVTSRVGKRWRSHCIEPDTII